GGTALPQVARAAVAARVGWAVLNRDASYIPELRRSSSAPVFGVSSDHLEIGRIQGRQFAALLPKGGSILYIQGPAENSAAKERTTGMQEAKPSNIHFTLLRAQWTEESAQRSVRSWLTLSTAQMGRYTRCRVARGSLSQPSATLGLRSGPAASIPASAPRLEVVLH